MQSAEESVQVSSESLDKSDRDAARSTTSEVDDENYDCGCEDAALCPRISSVDEAIESIGMGRAQWIWVTMGCLTMFAIAFKQKNLGVLMPELKTYFVSSDYTIASIASVYYLGLAVGCTVSGLVSDRIGRAPVIRISYLMFFAIGAISAASPSSEFFVGCELLLGVLFGTCLVTILVILAEILPIKYRGICIAITEASYGLGEISTVLFARATIPTIGWRWMTVLNSTPLLIVGILSFWYIPASPYYLTSHHKDKEAIAMLEKAAKTNNVQRPIRQAIRNMRVDMTRDTNDHHLKRHQYFLATMFNHFFVHTTVALIFIWMLVPAAVSLLPPWLPVVIKNVNDPSWTATSDDAMYRVAALVGIGEMVGPLLGLLLFPYFERRRIITVGSLFMALISVIIAVGNNVFTVIVCSPFLALLGKFVLTALKVYSAEVYPTYFRSSSSGFFQALAYGSAMFASWLLAYLLHRPLYFVAILLISAYGLGSLASLFLKFETLHARLGEAFYADFRGTTPRTPRTPHKQPHTPSHADKESVEHTHNHSAAEGPDHHKQT